MGRRRGGVGGGREVMPYGVEIQMRRIWIITKEKLKQIWKLGISDSRCTPKRDHSFN